MEISDLTSGSRVYWFSTANTIECGKFTGEWVEPGYSDVPLAEISVDKTGEPGWIYLRPEEIFRTFRDLRYAFENRLIDFEQKYFKQFDVIL